MSALPHPDAVKTLVTHAMDNCPQSMSEFKAVAAQQVGDGDDIGSLFEDASSSSSSY